MTDLAFQALRNQYGWTLSRVQAAAILDARQRCKIKRRLRLRGVKFTEEQSNSLGALLTLDRNTKRS